MIPLFVFLACLFLPISASGDMPSEEIAFHLDFSEKKVTSNETLADIGFVLRKGMKNSDEIEFSGNGDQKGLIVTAYKPVFGVAVHDKIDPVAIDRVVIEWGVDQYPPGADWAKQINREPLMVQLFFGPKVKADKFYLPASPYFIGLFLCEDGSPKDIFIGKNYTQTARYVCLDSPAEGELITSEIRIDQLFREVFATEAVPPLSAIGLEVDTTGLDVETSKAFLRRLTLHKKR